MITRTSIRSRLVALCLLLLAAAGLAVPGAASAQALRGSFFGVDAADGARLTIDRGGSGRLSDPGGRSFDFEGERSDGGISGQMPIAGGDALFRVDPLPYGALMTVIPLAADGSQRTDAAQVYTFVRRDLEVPALPEGFLPPPGEGVERFGALGFLRSYQFWAPDGVARGYAAMAPRHRRLVMLFPVVQLDIIWKLCLAPAGLPMVDRALSLAMDGQGVRCDDLLPVIAETQREGRFDRYKADVEEAGERVRRAIRCSDQYVETKATCDQAGRDISAAAVSLETAGSVLERYR